MIEDLDKESQIKKIEQLAYNFEKQYGGCPQAVLAAFKKVYDFIGDDLFRAGTGLAGGLGLSGEVCGALLGAAMVISVVCGRDYSNLEDKEGNRYVAFKMVRELRQLFLDEYGSIHCYDIQKKIMGRKFDLWDKDEKKAFLIAGGHEDKCPKVCGNAAKWAWEVMAEKNLIIKDKSWERE